MPSKPPRKKITIIDPADPVMSPIQLGRWIAEAKPGARISFWRGHIGSDRVDIPEARLVSDAAAGFVEKGLANVVQMRMGTFDFVYLLEKRP